MRAYFNGLADKIQASSSDVESRVHFVAAIRHLLQVVDYSLLEWIACRSPSPDTQPSHETLDGLRSPTDGVLVDSLDSLLISADQNGWSGLYRVGMAEIPDQSSALHLCADVAPTLFSLLRKIVALRNDGGEGHGLPGGCDREAELEAYKYVLSTLGFLLPRLDGSELLVGPVGGEVRLRMLACVHGRPVLVRRIRIINSSKVRIQAQYYGQNGQIESYSYEAANIFACFVGKHQPLLVKFDNGWRPLCYIPERITDTFTGRSEECISINDWFSDVESRACLVYGDGGVGKTTLVVEFLHKILEEEMRVEWRPRVISFYTAKRSQFGVDGLAPIGMGQPHLMDLLSHLYVLLFEEYPDRDFYRKSVGAAAMLMQERMRNELGLEKNEHLIIIDNAETLIENETERDQLGQEIKDVARRLGRIIVTSRRREVLGADPVEVKPLSTVEAVKFLRARGQDKLKISAIKKASDIELIDVVQGLERRPLVLDAFLNALNDPNYNTLSKAKERVAGMLRKDLGSFLFSDAWVRLSKDMRRLLVLMTRVADVHDSQSLKICANVCDISINDAERAIEESSGIASVVNIEGGVQISFSNNFLDFCSDKAIVTQEEINRAKQLYTQFLRRARAFTGDRVKEAFRIPVAKAAHRALAEGDISAAKSLYEQAVVTDSTNGFLFDRFAYFLFHEYRDMSAALHNAKIATGLQPNEGELWFTRGMIEARLGEVRSAEASLSRAEKFGVPKFRCSLQLAWAYLKAKPRQLGLATSVIRYLETASFQLPSYSKDRVEVQRLKDRLSALSG
ncbi:hypothetical protein ABQJ54_12725 [Rhodanobacter sp. Si-c]|uniref:AAA+ ATPase domain-containing protein n=1 Tax=Rhodanobacter lycopersici TaxID=3162487 RepID=A0ABV3QFJ8_9GAMM